MLTEAHMVQLADHDLPGGTEHFLQLPSWAKTFILPFFAGKEYVQKGDQGRTSSFWLICALKSQESETCKIQLEGDKGG